MTERALNLTWGPNERNGAEHVEWHAPCGCAFHPEPSPHVHHCKAHKPTVYDQAVKLVKKHQRCDMEFIQRSLGIGYILASECLERMQRQGIVSGVKGGKREVLK